MGKSMVSCRFSLKPIHWKLRNLAAGEQIWKSSQDSSFRKLILMDFAASRLFDWIYWKCSVSIFGTEDLTKFIKRKFRSLYFCIGEFSKHWHQQSLQRTVTAKKTWCKEDLMKRTVSAKKRHCKERTGTAKNEQALQRTIITIVG